MAIKDISKGTIIRTIMLVIVIINLILKSCGKNIIDIDEGTVVYYFETILEIAIIIVGFWKNNSYTENAQKADKFLRALQSSDDNDLIDDEVKER